MLVAAALIAKCPNVVVLLTEIVRAPLPVSVIVLCRVFRIPVVRERLPPTVTSPNAFKVPAPTAKFPVTFNPELAIVIVPPLTVILFVTVSGVPDGLVNATNAPLSVRL